MFVVFVFNFGPFSIIIACFLVKYYPSPCHKLSSINTDPPYKLRHDPSVLFY